MQEIEIVVKPFSELSGLEVYQILKLRQDIFIVEQLCPFPDIDDLDQKCDHLLAYSHDELVGYTRLSAPGVTLKNASVGRIVVAEKARNTGMGSRIVAKSMEILRELYPGKVIEISAQLYLKSFYEKHGFKTVGADYLLDGIPHVKMKA